MMVFVLERRIRALTETLMTSSGDLRLLRRPTLLQGKSPSQGNSSNQTVVRIGFNRSQNVDAGASFHPTPTSLFHTGKAGSASGRGSAAYEAQCASPDADANA